MDGTLQDEIKSLKEKFNISQDFGFRKTKRW